MTPMKPTRKPTAATHPVAHAVKRATRDHAAEAFAKGKLDRMGAKGREKC